MNDLEVYLINLDRSKDRLFSMKQKLLKLGLEFTRISAIDGRQTLFSNNQINEEKYSLCHGKYITATEVACYISHYNTLRKFLKSDKKYALILEDDIAFSKNFLLILKTLLKKSETWDFIKFNGAHSGGNIKYESILPNVDLVFNLFHQSKSGAYLLNKRAARAYVSKMLPMFVPVDHEYIKFWKYDLRGFSVSPFPSWEEGASSTIDYDIMYKNRKPFFKKFPTLVYKIYISLRRVIWVFSQILKNRFTFVKK